MTEIAGTEGDLPLTIPAILRRNVAKHGDKVFLACDSERLTYAEADARSRKLARAFLAAGVTKGSHIGLLYPWGADFVIAMLAAARIGAVVTPFSTLCTADELRWLLTNSDTGFLLAAQEFRSQDYVERLQKALPELDFTRPPPVLHFLSAPWLRHVFFSGPLRKGVDAGWSIASLDALAETIDNAYLDAVEARVSPADRFVIIYTSGSTGTPKGVMHAHGAVVQHFNMINQVRGLGPDDVFFSTFPWFWIAGFGFGLVATLVAGARIVVSNSTVPGDILDFLERERPTLTNGFARSVEKLAADPSFAERDLSSMRRGNLYPILAADVRPKDPALRHDIYGMSECGSGATLDSDYGDLPERLRGSCGRFLSWIEHKIVDHETGRLCEPGEAGELWIRGPFIMEGYYGRLRSEVFQSDGWWRTGDIGVVDADGYFFLKGRLGDMIKTSGANVSPREVESVLNVVTGGLQSVVLGIPDAQRGQVVAAVVISDGEIDEPGLKRKVAEKLSGYKVPRRVLRFGQAERPLLPNGKIDMQALTKMVQERWKIPCA